MPTCDYCDFSCEDEQKLTEHLAKAHECEKLSRIDQRRVESYNSSSGGLGNALTDLSRRKTLALVAGGITVGGGYAVSQQLTSESVETAPYKGSWEAGFTLPYPAEYPAVTAYEGELYVFGGGDENQDSQDIAYKFSPETESWTELATMPVKALRTSASVVGDRIYIIDGSQEDPYSHGNGTVRIYDPEADEWELGERRPVISRDPGQTTDGDLIYVFGGNHYGESIPSAHAYDPERDTWNELSQMPFPNRQFSCHYISNLDLIYMFGGESPDEGPERDDVLTYNPETDTYDDSPTNLPEPSQTIPSTVYRGKVLFAGGEKPDATTGQRTFRIYDPEIDAWDTLPDLVNMVEATDAAIIEDTLCVPGGRTYFEPGTETDEQPHQFRYGEHPVFHDRMQVYRFDDSTQSDQ